MGMLELAIAHTILFGKRWSGENGPDEEDMKQAFRRFVAAFLFLFALMGALELAAGPHGDPQLADRTIVGSER